MKKIIILSAFLLLMIAVSVKAQKHPNVQETSLRAPTSIKIDGKPTEWKDQFQAYNKATEIFYTVSNDSDKLYLTVQATDLDIINKIICGGITLTINGSGKMKDEKGVAITYPTLDKMNFPRNDHGVLDGIPFNLDKPKNWTTDSFIVVLNKQFTDKARDIKVEGVKGITNHLLSIYNPEGIRAAALFDNKTIFTYELAVPLNYLGLSVGVSKPFVYNIKLTGINPDLGKIHSVGIAIRSQRWAIRKDFILYASDNIPPRLEGPNASRLYYLFSPADFWGEYTLAK